MISKKAILICLSVLCSFILSIAAYLSWERNKMEVQIESVTRSPDGKWTAIVELEVYGAPAFVDEAVYSVRLKGPKQKDKLGDLVMNIPVNYPLPAPSTTWIADRLIVTLPATEKKQFGADLVDGISIVFRQK